MLGKKILKRVRRALEPIHDQIPEGTTLLIERVIYQDEIPVIATCFALVEETSRARGTFASITPLLEVSLTTEEDPVKLRAAVERWLAELEPTPEPYPLKRFNKSRNKNIFIPEVMPRQYTDFDPAGLHYTFVPVWREE